MQNYCRIVEFTLRTLIYVKVHIFFTGTGFGEIVFVRRSAHKVYLNGKMHGNARGRRAKMRLPASARPTNFSSPHHLYFCASTGQFSAAAPCPVGLTDFPARFCFREPFCSSRDRSWTGRRCGAGSRACRIYLFLSYALLALVHAATALLIRPRLFLAPLSAFSGRVSFCAITSAQHPS